MPGNRRQGDEVRKFILANIGGNRNIAALTSKNFEISLPAVYKHLDKLAAENKVDKKNGRYIIKSFKSQYCYNIDKTLSEDSVWEKDIKKHFTGIPQNIWQIWVYGFLEIFNNAIEHSRGKKINVIIEENEIYKDMTILDDGIGIFKNIKDKFKLLDLDDALLELVKGKRTTDIKRHSGQGIFFSSKVFDEFIIKSDGLIFNLKQAVHTVPAADNQKYSTLVNMQMSNTSRKNIKKVFDKFSTEVYGDFDKTVIPLHFASSSDLVSRSQARRVLSGLELFKEVTLDFKDIGYIDQAFADEVFRVFVNFNPETIIKVQNANSDVQYMINRAIKTKY
ncbi:MAG: DUF4325 domain-containing protein [Treponema sp.]|nr:DUF4325 domain-containing protein [Treponema sp.]